MAVVVRCHRCHRRRGRCCRQFRHRVSFDSGLDKELSAIGIVKIREQVTRNPARNSSKRRFTNKALTFGK